MHKLVVNNIEDLDAAVQQFTAEYTDGCVFSAKYGDTEYENKSVTELFDIEYQHLTKVDPDLDLNITAKHVKVDKHNLIYIHAVPVERPSGFELSDVCNTICIRFLSSNKL